MIDPVELESLRTWAQEAPSGDEAGLHLKFSCALALRQEVTLPCLVKIGSEREDMFLSYSLATFLSACPTIFPRCRVGVEQSGERWGVPNVPREGGSLTVCGRGRVRVWDPNALRHIS